MSTTQSHQPARSTNINALRRLGAYLRPVRGRMLGSGTAVFCSMLCGLAIPLLIQRILDGPVAHHDTGGLALLVTGIAVVGTGEALLFYLRRRLIAGPSTSVEARLRDDLYHHLQSLPIAFHDRWQSGQLLSRAVSDLSTLRRFIAFALIFLITNTVVLVVGLVVLFVLSPTLGIISLVCAAPLILISTLYESKYAVLARRSQDQNGDLATTVEESVLGVRVLKAFGRGRHLADRFAREAKELRRTELRKVHTVGLLWAAIIVLPEFAIGGQLLFGTFAIVDGTMTVGTLVAGVAVATYLRWPTDSIGWLLAETNQAATAAARYFEVLDAEITITSPAHPKSLPAKARGHVRFDDVRFAYPGSEGEEVLRGINLDLRPGETVALVGATGSGKTTLTALVGRLADVTGGRITVDGVDVRDLDLADLRTTVATAFEEPVLFSASVRENVALGATGATEADVRQALQVAAADFVDDLPWGLDTRIGEQGLSLSGGQRQRLALARAVVGRPSVLVLDDPLSALDVHTEAEVEHALRSVLSDVTALVVAHRSSTVQLADRVAMLSDGKITAIGHHSDLLATNENYRAMLSTMDEERDEVVA